MKVATTILKKERKGTLLKKREQKGARLPDIPNRRQFFRIMGGAILVGVSLPGLKMHGDAESSETVHKVDVSEKCTGCTGCVAVCPSSAISVQNDSISISEELCTGCGYCVVACPMAAIKYRKKAEQ